MTRTTFPLRLLSGSARFTNIGVEEPSVSDYAVGWLEVKERIGPYKCVTGLTPMPNSSSITLVLGGARSGKSRHAENLVAAAPAPWTYIATAQAFDDEMRERIASHRARRDENWQTVDAPLALADALESASGKPVLIDCLTLWLTNLLLGEQDIEQATLALEKALATRQAATVLVSNEVGAGIVPENKLARAFRDHQGWLNQRIAAVADQVVLVTAGLPLTLKGPSA
jgi:adenosylcobinamide kinase/adenosylcobinamide-phosphate guanylyltransferase